MNRSRLGRPWHTATFAVAVVALVLQLALIIAGQTVLSDAGTQVATVERVRRFFCYFTIQSNLLVAVSMWLVLRERTGTRLFRALRLASLVGITVTGVVAAVALPPSPLYTPLNLLCDRLLHVVVPLLTFVGWLAFGPRERVSRDDVLPALAWPIVWLVSTLALGPLVDWYPYPFLDVGTIGLGATLLNCGVIALLFVALASCAVRADRRLSRPRATMSP
ncbi:Pr6Pr family membrane protein [Terrabacter aeriphilus]|uniref:Pr6Pr family membrane protein n=1 Tax=Terrabacter aeriphilus TaxID=515662 RepID=A0ABP9J524_9MICO